MDRRTRARELAMQAVFQLDVQGDTLLNELDGFFQENSDDQTVRNLARQWTRGTWENIKKCDEQIVGATIKWQLSRLSMVDRAILRLSVYQLAFCPDIPPKVVINEAIELAKKYSTDKSPGFVNGVLDAILKKMQPKAGDVQDKGGKNEV